MVVVEHHHTSNFSYITFTLSGIISNGILRVYSSTLPYTLPLILSLLLRCLIVGGSSYKPPSLMGGIIAMGITVIWVAINNRIHL